MLAEKQSTTKQVDNIPSLQTPFRIGIIGLGRMGSYHASVCSLIQTIKLHAIADPTKENWNKITDKSVIKSTSYETWIDDVDAVIIAVPTDYHYEVTKTCLLKGKHVLLEKPLTKEIWQAEELFEIAKKKKCALHVGHVERFNGAVQELKKIIHKPYLIESHRIGPFSPRVQNDSVILDLMIHDIDIVLGLIGKKVVSFNVQGSSHYSKKSDIALVQLSFEDGTMANIVSSRASQIKRRMMSIHQNNAFIQLDFTTQDISIHRHTSTHIAIEHNQMKYTQEGTVERLFVYKDNPLKQEVEHFVTACTTNTNLIDPQQDIEALKLTLAIEKALQKL